MSNAQRTEAQEWSIAVTPVVAAVTTICASTALAGIIEGGRWLGFAGLAVIVVTVTGLGLRAIRTPTLLVGVVQMFVVLCLLVMLFTNSGVLGVLPGPSALHDIGQVLRDSAEVVRTGVPPVPGSTPVMCLVVIAIGLVAVLVDTLAVAAGTPAACGLVLLCVYAVPASLAETMLPWWSFVLGAGSFAALLAVDGTHRHRSGRSRPVASSTGATAGTPAALAAVAVALALLVGAGFTLVGTVGQLPGGSGSGDGGGNGLGIKPFTTLSGMLNREGNAELFRVRGLGKDDRYLRALTISTYNRDGGWEAPDAMPEGVPATGDLPPGPGDDGVGDITPIEIEPINSTDHWVPVYGTPRRLAELPGDLHYDPVTSTVYSETARKMPKYVEDADMSQPSATDLRAANGDYAGLSAVYLQRADVDPEVSALAGQLTADKPTELDKVLAVLHYFDPRNGFVYSTRTNARSDATALADFVFRTKVGFCEQYASAMGVLLRQAGIPSRVAIGYTAGYPNGDYRSITTSDAHAWVEVFFPGRGWITFDPTPLGDQRTYTPPYAGQPSTGSSTSQSLPGGGSEEKVPTGSRKPPKDPANPGTEIPNLDTQQQASSGLGWHGWTTIALVVAAAAAAAAAVLLGRRRPRPARLATLAAAAAWVLGVLAVFFAVGLLSWVLAVLVLLAALAATPRAVRQWRRRERLHQVAGHGPDAAQAAWAELLAETWDRGTTIPPADTVRVTARKLIREYDLDDDGQRGMRTVVTVLERSWYGDGSTDPALDDALTEVRGSLRRNAPLAFKAKMLPRSVLRPSTRRRKRRTED